MNIYTQGRGEKGGKEGKEEKKKEWGKQNK